MTLHETDDTRIASMARVLAPTTLIDDIPLPAAAQELVYRTRREISDAIHGRDDRLVVIVGPCSIHDPAAAMEYGARLSEHMQRLREHLQIVMRVYFEKPRTTIGWKGLINDPRLDNSYDINHGLHLARRLLVDLAKLGVPAGTEYLDPITPQYIGDVMAWSAIGARTTESQIHRQLASGLSCPVGFKNSTSGSTQVAVDALRSAREPHIFLSVTKEGTCAIFETRGNQDCHVILRGGDAGPNYDDATLTRCAEQLARHGFHPSVMVDCSHGNSEKKHARQIDVAVAMGARIAAGRRDVFGLMLESNLVEGRQELGESSQLTYGQSVTDACIGWEATVDVLERLADAVAARNGRDK